MGKHCCTETVKVCFKLGLYQRLYTVGAVTVAGAASTLSAALISATGGFAALTPFLNYGQTITVPYTSLNLVGGRLNAGTVQTSLGVAGITAQIYNGTPRLVIPGYDATAGAAALASLVTFGVASGTGFASGLTATLYFAAK